MEHRLPFNRSQSVFAHAAVLPLLLFVSAALAPGPAPAQPAPAPAPPAPPETDFGSAPALKDQPDQGALVFEGSQSPPTPPTNVDIVAPSLPATSILRQFDQAFASIFETASPSVVVIRVDQEELDESAQGGSTDPFSNEPNGFGLGPLQNEGSGFILDDRGHIATNLHVIEGAKKIRVRLKDGRGFLAKVVGVDDKTDIALLKIDAPALVPSRLADSDLLRVGQLVATIGAPYNLDYTFTLGIISGLGRTNFNVAAFEEYIQTDASINPGNSGGPLLDVEGRVVGMTTLVNGINRGLGFAIPINMVREVTAELARNGRVSRPWLGIGIDNFADTIGKSNDRGDLVAGVVVRSIAIESPAYGTDLRAGDVIVAVEGTPVATTRELQKRVLAKRIGDPISLTINRKGKRLEIAIKTAELPDASRVETTLKAGGKKHDGKAKPEAEKPVKPDVPAAKGPEKESSFPRPHPQRPDAALIGAELQKLDSTEAARLALPDSGGVIVRSVTPGLPAAKANLAKDDVIVSVGTSPIRDPEEFWDLLAATDPARGATLTVVRRGRRSVTTLTLPPQE